MAQRAYSARGEIVDFEIIKIKADIAAIPAPTTVSARRIYIDEKAGVLKPKESQSAAQSSSALAAIAVDVEAQGVDSETKE